ncbi:MAG TPA: citrate/2-methylcitrate synthase [Tepidisphaeraceae bacterium]|jgi:citrate synthase|nr:citrate/2-methylcitrate synthase [Tepidisphaeraceae bacterium]
MSESGSTIAAASIPPAAAPRKPGGGLEGVVAVQSEICFIDGNAGRLVYRGYEIADLVENSTFEEVAYLLWDGKLPNRAELTSLKKELSGAQQLPPHVLGVLKALPAQTEPMDALRTAISSAAATDPDLHCDPKDFAAQRRKAIRITAVLPTIVAAFSRLRTGGQPIAPDPTLSIAGNFLYMLNGKKPHETLTRVLDAALVLHAEHGMNASTFTARVTAATLADMHAAITAATAALKGPLHGGANEDVMHLLLECGDANTCETVVKDKLSRGDKIPGFGHRVYRTFDPRAHFLRKMSKQLGDAAGNTKWYEMSERLIPIMKDSPASNGQPRNLNPNVDFFSASTYYTMGIPIELFTPLFAISRAAGWTAHVMEQHKNNRIIRPTDDYHGPFDLKVTPVDQRP